MVAPRPKTPKITFDAVKFKFPYGWQLLVHRPGFRRERISGFTSKAEAEAWPSTEEGKEWLRARGYGDSGQDVGPHDADGGDERLLFAHSDPAFE